MRFWIIYFFGPYFIFWVTVLVHFIRCNFIIFLCRPTMVGDIFTLPPTTKKNFLRSSVVKFALIHLLLPYFIPLLYKKYIL